MTTDERWMSRAIELAENAGPYGPPNPKVGAIIVYQGKIIGEGYHTHAGMGHAEVNAIRSVKDHSLLKESTLYVTLEPCSHYGKTPPCTLLLIEKQIKEVVIGTSDPFHQVNGKGIQMLMEAGIKVRCGILEEQCKRLIKKFLTTVYFHRPFITLKWAQSSDGYIAPSNIDQHSSTTFISNLYTQIRVHRLRTEHQAILIGKNTALTDNPQLTPRLWSGLSPMRICIDSDGKLPDNLHIFNGNTDTLIVGYHDSEERHKNGHYEFLQVQQSEELLPTLMKELYDRKIQALLVEGGRETLMHFISSNLWDEAHVEIGIQKLNGGIPAPTIPNGHTYKTEIFFNHIIHHYNHTL